MSDFTCNQHVEGGGTCPDPAAYRYTWPGHDEAGICEDHGAYMRKVATALGLHLQMIPLKAEEVESE